MGEAFNCLVSWVRRVGKTTLARMLPDTVYLNCDLPSVCRRLTDPESFYDGLKKGATIVFDEVHRLDDPSRLLKIAADEYPHLKVLATGSSTLAATRKFRDSLTGRKLMIYLPPSKVGKVFVKMTAVSFGNILCLIRCAPEPMAVPFIIGGINPDGNWTLS